MTTPAQNTVVRSTYAAELMALLDALGTGTLMNVALTEISEGVCTGNRFRQLMMQLSREEEVCTRHRPHHSWTQFHSEHAGSGNASGSPTLHQGRLHQVH